MFLNVKRRHRCDLARLPLGVARALWVLILVSVSPAMLGGCAGTPVREIASLELSGWRVTADGSYTAACVDAGALWTISRFAVERWSLQDDGPPTFVERAVHPPNLGKPLGLSACPDGSKGQGLSHGGPLKISLRNGQKYLISARGRALMRGDVYVDWRRLPGALKDATFDGEVIWAVGEDSLWRWASGRAQFASVALPNEVSMCGPIGIFRDGSALWIRTRDHVGWPLVIRGNYAHHAGKSGPLPKSTPELQLPLAGKTLLWRGPGEPLVINSDAGEVQRLSDVDALMPIGPGHLIVGSGDTISFWDLRAALPRRLKEWPVAGETLRFFLKDDQIHAVGREYGVLTGQTSGGLVN